MADAESERLAALLRDDSEDVDDERLKSILAEDSDDEPPPPPPAPPAAAAAAESPGAAPPLTNALLDRISRRLEALQSTHDDAAAAAPPARAADVSRAQDARDDDAAAVPPPRGVAEHGPLWSLVKAHERAARAAPPEIVIDYVWENQRRRRKSRGRAGGDGAADAADDVRWAACSGGFRGREPWSAPARASLAALFKKRGGPGAADAAGDALGGAGGGAADGADADADADRDALPDATWRWLGPWVVESSGIHGSDRHVSPDDDARAPDADGWLYAPAWPPGDCGYSAAASAGAAVRCRRWVRPRERRAASAVAHALLGAGVSAEVLHLAFVAATDEAHDAAHKLPGAGGAGRDAEARADLGAVLRVVPIADAATAARLFEPRLDGAASAARPLPRPPRAAAATATAAAAATAAPPPLPPRREGRAGDVTPIEIDYVWEHQRWCSHT